MTKLPVDDEATRREIADGRRAAGGAWAVGGTRRRMAITEDPRMRAEGRGDKERLAYN